MINYGKHYIDKNDINSVIKVLKSDFLTQGPNIKLFENKLKSIISSVSTSGLEFLRSFQLYLSENNIDLNGKKKSYHELLVGIKNNKTNLIEDLN